MAAPDSSKSGAGGLAHHSPTAVRIAAGRAARGLGAPVDVDVVGVLAAAQTARLVIWSGDDRSVIRRTVAAPADRRPRSAILERLHFCRIGPLAVLLVERGSNRATQQSARGGPDQCPRDAISSAAAAEK